MRQAPLTLSCSQTPSCCQTLMTGQRTRPSPEGSIPSSVPCFLHGGWYLAGGLLICLPLQKLTTSNGDHGAAASPQSAGKFLPSAALPSDLKSTDSDHLPDGSTTVSVVDSFEDPLGVLTQVGAWHLIHILRPQATGLGGHSQAKLTAWPG